MNFIKISSNEKGEEEILKIDPTKIKIIQGSPTGMSKITSSINNMEKGLENFQFKTVLIPSSLIPQNFVQTQRATSSTLFTSEPTLPNIINRQAFNLVDLNTITNDSESSFTIVSSSSIHSHSVNNTEKLITKTEQSLSSVSEDTSKENWTEAEIQLLLERRLSMNDKFENPNSRKAPYWNLIVKAFEEKGYKVKVQDLINKWKNLLVTYNRNVSKLKKTDESSITWKYFQMHEIFAEKKSVNPPETSLGSTFKSETLTLDKLPKLPDDTYKENASAIEHIPQKRKMESPKKSLKKLRFQEEMLQIIKEKKSQSLNLKKEIWEDKKKIAESKIEAINNLASLLKSLQKNRLTNND